MGLDMYLKRKTFVGANYEHRNITVEAEVDGEIIKLDFKKLKNLSNGDNLVNVDFDKIQYFEEEFGYWRKANAIHKWFVSNVQEGVDDCGDYYVTRDKLKELLSVCQSIIADKDKARELLPTTNGFFFGPTDYDEHYIRDIKDTISILKKALKDENVFSSFYYHSSW